MRTRLRRTILLAAAISALGASSASAGVRIVDNSPGSVCKKGTDPTVYATIQDGVDAAVRNDSVVVCPGTYAEEVEITTDGLKLQSNTNLAATITRPVAAPLPMLVHVDAADNVLVRGFVL